MLIKLKRYEKIRGSYHGYYNGNLLRSAYEYVYAKYLESQNKNFKTEYITYKLDNDYTYTPDFFIFNNDGELEKIVEIRGHRLDLQERINDVNILKNIVDVEVLLLTELDLREICKLNNLNYNQLKNEWRNSKDTELNKSSGEFNVMFGKHHNAKTKEILSLKGKERMSNIEYKNNIVEKMITYCRETNYADAKKPRSKRVVKICPSCNKEFITTEADQQMYCSIECYANSDINKNILNRMSLDTIERTKILHNNVKEFAMSWAMENKLLIIETPFNKITTKLYDLQLQIEKIFGIKDWRIISKAICGSESKKDLLNYLKLLN